MTGEVKSRADRLGNDKLKKRRKWILKKKKRKHQVYVQGKEWWCWCERALRQVVGRKPFPSLPLQSE